MKKNNLTILLIAVLASLFIALLISSKIKQEATEESSDLATSKNQQARQTFDLSNKSDRNSRFDQETAFILEAYKAQDEELLRARVQELLDKDFDLALAVFAKLDYTFLDYEMSFPHDLVVTYLEEHFDESESMEILSQYVSTSSITASIMSLYFDGWFDRDHLGQFEWFRKNSTFHQPTTMHSYTEKLGQSEKALEMIHLVDELPVGDVRKEQVHMAMLEFMSTAQPDLLGRYINGIDELPETAYNPISNMAERIINDEGDDNLLDSMDKAVEWVDLIEDDYFHLTSLSKIASHLHKKNPDGFQKWLGGYDFSGRVSRDDFMKAFEEEVAFLKSLEGNEQQDLEQIRKLNLTEHFGN